MGHETKGDRREARRQRERYGMRVSGRNMAQTIARSQAKRLRELDERAARRGGKGN